MKEADIMRRIMMAVSRAGARVWRNNVAMAWVGKPEVIRQPKRVAVGPGDVVVRQARPLRAGLCPGSHDLIGVTPVMIEPRHVGLKVGVFTSIEVKADDGRTSEEQENFREQIESLGGLTGIARGDDDAIAIIQKMS